MRSLALLSGDVIPFEARQDSQTVIAVDADDGSLYIASSHETADGILRVELFHAPPSRNNREGTALPKDCRSFAFHETPAIAQFQTDRYVVSLQILPETSQLCIITSGGEILLASLPSNSNVPDIAKVEVVGSFDEGIKAAKWSPDDELLVLITGDDKLVLMTKTFDSLVEEFLHPTEFGEERPVNVGWGKKTTQFHGSLGKTAAQSPSPASPSSSSVTTSLLLQNDNLIPRISWRGDGAHFCISSVSAASPSSPQRRIIRFYNRAGVHSSTSEPADSQGSELAWRPEGSIIATTRGEGKEAEVVFFERNGLRRYEFRLRWGEGEEGEERKVKGLEWNADSSILAVWIRRRFAGQKPFVDSVQLWTRNNYHWYLKQELQPRLTPGNPVLSTIVWHPERSLQLYLATPTSIESRTLSWQVFSDTKPIPNDTGSVAVVDGSSLLLTPFRYQNVPPPMSSLSIPMPSASTPTHVAFSSNSPHFAVLFPDGSVDVYEWKLGGEKGKTNVSMPTRVLPLPAGGADEGMDGEAKLAKQVAIGLLPSEEKLRVTRLSALPDGVDRIDQADLGSLRWSGMTLGYGAVGLRTGNDGGAYVQSATGAVQSTPVEDEDDSAPKDIGSFPEACATWTMLPQGVPLGLSEGGRLYLRSRAIATDCLSFAVDASFLIMTTFSHTAKFIHLSSLFTEETKTDEIPILAAKKPAGDAEISRKLERGSRIVAVVPSNMSLILQMPRGNLETIFPRALVLEVVLRDLDAWRYRSAFLACRKHRVDLNVLHDHDPASFLANAEAFVEQLGSVDHLNLFLTALRPVDVCETMYKSIAGAKPPAEAMGDTKVNLICGRILDVLGRRDAFTWANSVLTAHLSKRPKDYESALQALSILQARDPDRAEDAVKYIIFLSDSQRLYHVALGMYDLSLTVLIAQHSQMDPKEYLPFLRSLRELDDDLRRFTIDDHLRRYSKAVGHLARSIHTPFEDVLAYTRRHSLYHDSLAAYRYDKPKTKLIREAQGDYLLDLTQAMDAALAYTLAGSLRQAISAYRDADAWQEALATAKLARYSEEELADLADELIDRLSDSGRFIEVARIKLDELHDVDGGVQALCQGAAFAEAIRVAHLHSLSRLVPYIVQPAVVEHAELLVSEITGASDQLGKQCQRLAELKTLRDADPDAFYLSKKQEGDGAALEGLDAMTDATTALRTDYTRYTAGASIRTGGTRTSRSSKASSKSRRKEERKKATGKRGSVYEEEYLLQSIRQTCLTKLPELQGQVGALLPVMVRLSNEDAAPIAVNGSGSPAVEATSSKVDFMSLADNLQQTLSSFEVSLATSSEGVWTVRERELEEVERKLLEGGTAATELFAEIGRGAAMGPGKLVVERPVLPPVGTWRLALLNDG